MACLPSPAMLASLQPAMPCLPLRRLPADLHGQLAAFIGADDAVGAQCAAVADQLKKWEFREEVRRLAGWPVPWRLDWAGLGWAAAGAV